MKKIALFAAAFVFILVLTKIANNVPPDPPTGTAFWLKAEKVVQCSPTEITLVDPHDKASHLEKDESWPSCDSFTQDEFLDFKLARGEKTKFLSMEKTVWWRKSL